MADEIKQEGADERTAEEKPLDKMTAPELREIAKEIPGVEGVHAMKKDELLAVIKESRGIPAETPAKKKKAVKEGRTAKELKKEVARLKDEKAAASEGREKRRVDILRRRINRTKKRSRKASHA